MLLAVCDAGSVTSAARELGVDKATVSRRVGSLERDLGLRLMVRRTKGWRPTRAGERVAAAARAMDGSARTLLADLAGKHGAPRTAVSITAPHWFCQRLLLPALPTLTEAMPWLDVCVSSTSRMLSLAQREADVALRNRRPDQGDFTLRRAGTLGSALYAARSYVKERGVPGPGSLAGHSVIGYLDRLTYVPGLAWLENAIGSAMAIHRMDDAGALLAATSAGLGAAVLPCFLGDPARGLQRLGDVHQETIWLVSPSELAGTRAVRASRKFVVELFARNENALAGA